MTHYFIQAFIYLLAAVIAVPLAKRFGLGSVLGYLIAGVVIGPVTGLVGAETNDIQHFAEFGVVMMLFLVGLELEPKILWEMKHKLIGLGGLQVSLTVCLAAGIALLFSMPWQTALVIGFIFSLSSTAIVLQTFQEKGLARTDGGRSAFSVLLFQDIAVIPMLAFIPLLALPQYLNPIFATAASHEEALSLVAHLVGWQYAAVVMAAIIFVILAGHFLSKPLFRIVANSGVREIFTATTLMLVIGIAALMSLVGLSPALGTFIAGVILANSEFKHELESNLEPFKGLLLGLFFITVGAGINFVVVQENARLVLGITFAVITGKALILFGLALLFKIRRSDGWLLALSLAQAGEFGFVLLSFSTQYHALPLEYSAILSPAIAISMFLTPILFIVFDKIVLKQYANSQEVRDADAIDEKGLVIVAGIGRFGQIINRFLVANGVNTVVLDQSTTIVERVKRINMKSYFGDASRPDLLHTAGIEQAKLLVIAIDDQEKTLVMTKHAKQYHPHVTVLARAYDRGHAYALLEAGADHVFTETYFSALEMGKVSLEALGMHPFAAEQLKESFTHLERKHHINLLDTWKNAEEDNRFNNNYIELFMALENAINDAMKSDTQNINSTKPTSWQPLPKDDQYNLEKNE